MRKKNFYFKALGILRKTFEGIKKNTLRNIRNCGRIFRNLQVCEDEEYFIIDLR